MSHQKTGFYYKGYGIKVLNQNHVSKIKECANDMIEDDRQKGETEENIKKKYLRNIETYFNHLKQHKTPGLSHPSDDDLERLVKDIPECNNSKEHFVVLWSTTVLALLELGVIPNDENNGIITVIKETL